MHVTETLSVRVTKAIAELEGCDPALVSPPLVDVIEPEAIDSLTQWGDDTARIEFEYAGHEVSIEASGEVYVDDRRFPPSGN
jgi:hypothetical protein